MFLNIYYVYECIMFMDIKLMPMDVYYNKIQKTFAKKFT